MARNSDYVYSSKEEYDNAINEQKKLYAAGKAQDDADAMEQANYTANQIRKNNSYGDEQQDASQDIQNTRNNVAAIMAAQTANSNSSEQDIKDMYEEKQKAQIAALESAYKNNIVELDVAKEQIPIAYRSARNQAAGTSSQEKQNFAEYAAGNGLNSGAGGQAELARSVTLRGNLNSLNQEEANALADLEMQRTQLTNEYRSAIASAKAEGNYELANALYQESVRADEALTEYQTTQWSQQQTENQSLANYGWAILQSGNMPSDSMLAAIGIDKATAQAIIDSFKKQTTNGW